MKKLKLQWKGIYALLLMLWSVPLPAQFPLVEQISSNFITSFAEDPKGYIWIGTNHGLNRFSGSNYTVYYAQEESTYNPQIQISAESETKRSIFRKRDKTKRSKKESAQHSKSRNKSFVMTSVSAL